MNKPHFAIVLSFCHAILRAVPCVAVVAVWSGIVLFDSVFPARAAEGSFAPSLALAETFLAEGNATAAALEYRRMEADADPAEASLRRSLLLAAADAYRSAADWNRMGRVLDRLDDDVALHLAPDPERSFLHLRRAEGLRLWADAAERAEELAESLPAPADAVRARRLAAADWLLAGDPREARRAAADAPDALAAIDRWEAGHDKSPRLGGLLGLVPGLGYAYCGEWGNALRSLFLNGLFGWAMWECADHEEWGLFAVTTFFELTWYTGSVYGGIDAVHRYNRARLGDAADAVRGGSTPSLRRTGADGIPDNTSGTVGLFRLRLVF